MSSDDFSDQESDETNDSGEGEVEVETPGRGRKVKIGEYEKQRIKRMEENRVRMEALGLHKIASSLMASPHKKKRDPKGKRKAFEEDDEDYMPPQQQEGQEEEEEDDDDDESSGSRTRTRTRTNKAKKKTSTPSKKVHVQKVSSNKNFLNDDDALMQAIALSLQDSAGFLDVRNSIPSQSSDTHVKNGNVSERKGNAGIREDTGKRKTKKSISNRVQMTEDELILHFYQIDEAGKGNITLRDLQRVAAAYDFTWSDSELADMIYCFDSNGDGKINLDNFRKIVGRCNMIQKSEDAAMGSKA